MITPTEAWAMTQVGIIQNMFSACMIHQRCYSTAILIKWLEDVGCSSSHVARWSSYTSDTVSILSQAILSQDRDTAVLEPLSQCDVGPPFFNHN